MTTKKIVPFIRIPTDEEMAAGHQRWVEYHRPNDMSEWYPKLLGHGFKMPRTEIVVLPKELTHWVYGESCSGTDVYVEMVSLACDRIGYPCFLRSGLSSDKHSWKDSCYVPDRQSVRSHMESIGMFCGCVDIPILSFIARELLPTVPSFHAFSGNMPIVREFRFFVRDNVISHWQPYWPENSIEGHTQDPDWRQKLETLNQITNQEFMLLSSQSLDVGKVLDDFWSIDWLQVGLDWYLTDVAIGSSSYAYDRQTGERIEAP